MRTKRHLFMNFYKMRFKVRFWSVFRKIHNMNKLLRLPKDFLKMFLKMWKEECHAQKLKLYHPTPEDFDRCWFQKKKEISPIWVSYRTIVALYFIGTLFYSDADNEVPVFKRLIFLTHWTYFLEFYQFLFISFITVSKYVLQKKKGPLPPLEYMPWYYRQYWMLFTTVLSCAVLVSIVFWTSIYDPVLFPANAHNIIVHGLNSFFMILDFFLVGHPVRFLHFYLPCLLGLIYLLFTIIYQHSGGTGVKGLIPIYKILDWRYPKKAVLTFSCCFFLLIEYKIGCAFNFECIMVPQKGTLILNHASLKLFKAKDRQAAQVLQEVGLNEINWFKNKHTVKHYICPSENCNELFVDLYLMKNHFFKTHNGRPFKCDFNNCKWSFATKSKLERHKNSHLNLKWFKCIYDSCGKMFTTLYNLRQHLKTVHEKADQFVCTVKDCNAAFHNQRNLDLHKATHEDLGRSYICSKEGCDKSFVTKNALCSHLRSHEHKLEDLKCSWEGCSKVFELPCRLREHMRVHTGEKPFRCDHPGCGWSFYSGSKLHRHRNKHLQIRKFVCCVTHCKKSFLRSQHLKEHILTHSKNNLKNFSCPIKNCNSKFASRNVVYRHVKKVHQQDSKRSNISNHPDGDFSIKISKQQDQPQLLSSQCINQLDTLSLLTGDYDVCSAENVPLNSQLPELMPSELLVAMTSIDSGNGDSLTDITAVDSSCNNQSLVVMTHIEANNNETLIINDNMKYILDGSSPAKSIKKKSAVSGSARTNYTYKDVIREKTYKAELEDCRRLKWQCPDTTSDDFRLKKWKNQIYSKQSEDLPNCKMSIPSDLVLGAGISDHNSLIVKDELYPQEDLQVLLLDQTKIRNPIFEPSTINLRDLE